MPQAFKSMIPAIVSQLISLIKDTSLAVIISLPELSHQARIIYGQNTNYVLPMFIIMTLMYFVVCYALSCFPVTWKETVQLLIDDSFSGCGRLKSQPLFLFPFEKREFDCFKQVRALENSG